MNNCLGMVFVSVSAGLVIMGMSWLVTCCRVAEHLGLLITQPYLAVGP